MAAFMGGGAVLETVKMRARVVVPSRVVVAYVGLCRCGFVVAPWHYCRVVVRVEREKRMGELKGKRKGKVAMGKESKRKGLKFSNPDRKNLILFFLIIIIIIIKK